MSAELAAEWFIEHFSSGRARRESEPDAGGVILRRFKGVGRAWWSADAVLAASLAALDTASASTKKRPAEAGLKAAKPDQKVCEVQTVLHL